MEQDVSGSDEEEEEEEVEEREQEEGEPFQPQKENVSALYDTAR